MFYKELPPRALPFSRFDEKPSRKALSHIAQPASLTRTAHAYKAFPIRVQFLVHPVLRPQAMLYPFAMHV